MFNNIGGKIKGLAKFVCWAGIVISVIAGIVMMVGGASMGSRYGTSGVSGASIVAGLLTAVIGSIIAWLGSLMTYGFGQLVENSDIIRQEMNK